MGGNKRRRMTMAMSEAEKRACLKYQRSLAQFSIKLKPEELQRYKEAAEKAGMTFRAWVLTAMNDACTDTD